MKQRVINKHIATIVIQVVVDKNDEAFQNPTKPIRPLYSKERSEVLLKEKDIVMVEDSGRGHRRVVPSPKSMGVH